MPPKPDLSVAAFVVAALTLLLAATGPIVPRVTRWIRRRRVKGKERTGTGQPRLAEGGILHLPGGFVHQVTPGPSARPWAGSTAWRGLTPRETGVAIGALLGIGLAVNLFSASGGFHPGLFWPHAASVLVGVTAMTAISRARIPDIGGLRMLHRLGWSAMLASVPIMIAASVVKGYSSRIVFIGPIPVEPAYLLVLGYFVSLPLALSRPTPRRWSHWSPAVMLGLVLSLLLLQPNISMVFLVFGVTFVMYVAARIRVYVLGGLLVVAGLFAFMMAISPQGEWRLEAYLHPGAELYQHTAGFQQTQALHAMASAGPIGNGVGAPVPSLPAAETDFVVGLLAQRLGLLTVCAVVGMLGVVVAYGLRVVRTSVDGLVRLLALGITSFIAAEGLLHLAVNLGLAPVLSADLPFVSHGPTPIIVYSSIVGLLFTLERAREE